MKYINLLAALVLSFAVYGEETSADLAASIEAATGWTEDELVAGLNRLDRLYQNDMATAEGRKRWHGAITNSVLDETRWVIVETHADGYVYERKSNAKKRAKTPEEIAAIKAKRAAELAKRMPAAAVEATVAREESVATTNEVSVVVTPEEAK